MRYREEIEGTHIESTLCEQLKCQQSSIAVPIQLICEIEGTHCTVQISPPKPNLH